MTRHGSRSVRRGFTLIEMISTIVVLSAVGTVASSILMNATEGYLAATTSAQLHAEVSIALDRINRELRGMSRDGTAPGSAPDIESITTTAITWNDNDTLALIGSDLMLTVNGGTARVLLTDVSAFELAAFDESNDAVAIPAGAAACDPIRRLSVDVTVTRHGVSETLRTKVFLRCTMTGTG